MGGGKEEFYDMLQEREGHFDFETHLLRIVSANLEIIQLP
jgi:hypothetical protein